MFCLRFSKSMLKEAKTIFDFGDQTTKTCSLWLNKDVKYQNKTLF